MNQPEASPNTGQTPTPEAVQSAPEVTAPAPEAHTNPEAPAAQSEQSPERGANINTRQGGDPGVSLPPVQAPTATAPATPATNDNNQTDDNPLIADDVDVIEMEWVNKAKQIIKQTAGDPHAQEKAVEKLQIDYLKKRYGKDVKGSRSD